MRIVPAVDIRGGLCVNLVQGDYDQETVFSEQPVDQAQKWRQSGAEIVHIVDLDGAKAAKLCVESHLKELQKAAIPYEIGGGIRDMKSLARAIELGAQRAILGTAAHSDPTFLAEAISEFPGKIVVGIDAKNGKVALSAWQEVTETHSVEFAKLVEQAGVSRIIYTDILSDGMMKGPNLDATKAVAESISIPVTASGGMSSIDDIRAVCDLEDSGVDEVIIGRALYLGAFTLERAIEITREKR